MSGEKKIRSALISVFHKENLEPVIRALHSIGIKIYSTGGTQSFIESLKIPCIPVEEITGYPSILGGRVKTLHPKIFGGILRRDANESDLKEIAAHRIPEIDLVVVDLYPFEATVESGAAQDEIIEKIDIGGISLIRASAKNFNDVLVIPSRNDYGFLLKILNDKKGISAWDERKQQALKAFEISSGYDAAIRDYFSKGSDMPASPLSAGESRPLRYGENPHQQAVYKGNPDEAFQQLQGKELSYNNILDIDAAISLIHDFDECTFAVIKHNNACGAASEAGAEQAWKKALAGDPVSAFGGIIVANREIDEAAAGEISKLFFEILIAPSFSKASLGILAEKKNRIILKLKKFELPKIQIRSVLNGVLEQERDVKTETANDFKFITDKKPSESETEDLIFANKIVKHSKSNAIVIARAKQLLGSGVGQTSRVDALNFAIEKAKRNGFDLSGAVMASDAFFPFPDCVEIAHKAGITAVIQPGGSVKDKDSVEYCNRNSLAMVMTGFRHFKH